jgi:hypothetical protein
MQWRGEKRPKRRNSVLGRTSVAWLTGILISCAIAWPAAAVDSEVGAIVCGTGSPGAAIDITQPNDDSVVDQAITTFRGSINNTSQIIVEIDGDYVSTVAIGSNQSVFDTDISLSEGTHTIKMTANDICGTMDASDSVVITYQPDTNPSNGETTPTEVDGEPNVTVVTDEQIEDDDIAQRIEQLPLIGAAVSVVADFVNISGLESTVSTGNVTVGVARVGITVAALTSVVMASSLAPVAAQALPGLAESFNISSHRSMIYLGWAIRGAGILTMAIVYFL